LPKICITANVQERDFTLQNFLFLQNCAETWNFSMPKKIDLRKTTVESNLI
jgi:hypothetical protein